MSACFHINGVVCDNCRNYTYQGYPNNVNTAVFISVGDGLRARPEDAIHITDESLLALRQKLAKAESDRNEARELLAVIFDRFACAACSHGKTSPDCPCGFHHVAEFLDRMEQNETSSGRLLEEESDECDYCRGTGRYEIDGISQNCFCTDLE